MQDLDTDGEGALTPDGCNVCQMKDLARQEKKRREKDGMGSESNDRLDRREGPLRPAECGKAGRSRITLCR